MVKSVGNLIAETTLLLHDKVTELLFFSNASRSETLFNSFNHLTR
jgi:hypothetical protein